MLQKLKLDEVGLKTSPRYYLQLTLGRHLSYAHWAVNPSLHLHFLMSLKCR